MTQAAGNLPVLETADAPQTATAPAPDAGAGSGGDPLVTVVVPTYNRRESAERLLRALAEQTFPARDFEVVVVDDGSADGTVEALRRWPAPFPLRVCEQAHQGPAAARNLGVAQARGELILFLDDDVVPIPELIAVHVAAHRAHPDAVVIGPMSPPGAWPRSAWVRWEEQQLQTQYRAMIAGKYACTFRQFYTGNASLPRDWFVRAGGFDVRFTRAEDVELGYRLRNLGARFVFDARADALHYASRSFDAWCRTPYQYGRFDVLMDREKGHETMLLATSDFHYRHPLNRALARACVGRGRIFRGAVATLRRFAVGAERLRALRAATLALSAIFNLQYWQGVCDELGGREAVWHSVAAARHRR